MNEEYIKEEDAIMLLERMMPTLPKTIRANFATEMVKQIPRPDVVERKRGEWIDKNGAYNRRKCSLCGKYALYRFINVGSFKETESNFCPNCGADMRGENNG